jgi:hypothetical protein
MSSLTTTHPRFPAGTRVRIGGGEGQSLHRWRSVHRPATVIGHIGPFAVVDVDGLGIRRCLAEYLEDL